MITAKELTTFETELAHFTGTEKYYRHPLNRHIHFTDGIKFLCEKLDCFWMMDIIVSVQGIPSIKKCGCGQYWHLEVFHDKKAIITCTSNEVVLYRQDIQFTDFPLQEITVLCANGVICLLSED